LGAVQNADRRLAGSLNGALARHSADRLGGAELAE
jgi:hypothetical protein